MPHLRLAHEAAQQRFAADAPQAVAPLNPDVRHPRVFSALNAASFDDRDFKEDSVRELVIAPMLTKLGYQPRGEVRVIRSKTLKHPFIRVGTRNHPVNIIPDYTLLLRDKPAFVLDAKGPNEDVLDREHVQQAYSYSIHPEIKAKEFALCNGRQLAIYSTEQSEPLLVLRFEEFESRWSDIEKYLAPRFLAEPALRNFAPDFGFKLKRLGIDSRIALVMMGTRLNLFGRVSDDLITASANTNFADEEHCASFDFPPSLLPAIVSGLPEPLREQFTNALRRSPFQASAGLAIELDLTARLGEETQGQSEVFIPLLIEEVHESRFNPAPVEGDPNDTPAHVFKLRDAFRIRGAEEKDA